MHITLGGFIGSDCPDIFANLPVLFAQEILYPPWAYPNKGFHCPHMAAHYREYGCECIAVH
jgi:hypothetical protein